MYTRVKNKLKEIRDCWGIRRSGLFDRESYLRNNLDVARSCMNPIKHYIRHGWHEGRKPCESFDTRYYLDAYPDVVEKGVNPFCHYVQFGIKEGREGIKCALELKSVRDKKMSILAHTKSSQEHFFYRGKSLILVIDHNLGGGANHYRNQLIDNLVSKSKDVLLLHNIVCHGKEMGYRLILFSGKEKESIEYEKVDELFSLLETLPIREVFYNSLVYYSELELFLNKLVLWSKSGIKTVFAIHDFFPVCPSFNLIDGEGKFCKLHSISQCPPCLESISLDHIKKPINILNYKTLWQDVLRSAAEILCFSNTSALLLRKAYPLLNEHLIKIIPHSMDYFKASPIELIKTRNGHIKIAVVGDIFSIPKGSRFIQQFANHLLKEAPKARIYVFGKYDGANKNIVHMGAYKPHDLGDLMQKHRIDVAFIPSVWPETFSYLTSELIMIGVPLVCFDMGAQAEKVREYELGAVIPEISLTKTLETIDKLYYKVYGKKA